MARERTCIKCKEVKPLHLFKKTPSTFMPGGRSIICTQCLGQMIEQDNLDSVDALCRWLDLPFDPNEWTKLYAIHGDNTLPEYFDLLSDEKYDASNWSTENERWRLIRENGETEEEMEIMSKAEASRLRQKWSEFYNMRELRFLEEYYNEICATQNVTTPILREYACDLCELELQIKKGVRAGEDVKKLMDAKDNIIKMAKFEANNSKNATDFDSVGELFIYLVKKGFHPNWKSTPKDDVDLIMGEVKNWWTRFAQQEGNFTDQVADKRQKYELTERLSTDEEVEEIEESIEYEDAIDLGDDE